MPSPAILFVTHREHRLLSIEKTTRQPIAPMPQPSGTLADEQCRQQFLQGLQEALSTVDPGPFRGRVLGICATTGSEPMDILAVLARRQQPSGTDLLTGDGKPAPHKPAGRYKHLAGILYDQRPERNHKKGRTDLGGKMPAKSFKRKCAKQARAPRDVNSTVNPDHDEAQLAREVDSFRRWFRHPAPLKPGIYRYAPLHFRMWTEFRVWHEGGDSFYAMTSPGEKKPKPVEGVAIGSRPMLDLMRRPLNVIDNDDTLRQKALCRGVSDHAVRRDTDDPDIPPAPGMRRSAMPVNTSPAQAVRAIPRHLPESCITVPWP